MSVADSSSGRPLPAVLKRIGLTAALAALCLALFLPGFFTLPPTDRDEARFAQATRQMLESGDFVDIRFQDEARHKKPVGIHWMQSATVALAARGGNGGFDTVRVKLIADPGIARNVHEVAVRSGCADFTIRLEGRPSPANPKTSLTAGYSVARELLNRASATVI